MSQRESRRVSVKQSLQLRIDRVTDTDLVEHRGEGLDVPRLVQRLRGGVELGVEIGDGLHDSSRGDQGALLAVQELAELPAGDVLAGPAQLLSVPADPLPGTRPVEGQHLVREAEWVTRVESLRPVDAFGRVPLLVLALLVQGEQPGPAGVVIPAESGRVLCRDLPRRHQPGQGFGGWNRASNLLGQRDSRPPARYRCRPTQDAGIGRTDRIRCDPRLCLGSPEHVVATPPPARTCRRAHSRHALPAGAVQWTDRAHLQDPGCPLSRVRPPRLHRTGWHGVPPSQRRMRTVAQSADGTHRRGVSGGDPGGSADQGVPPLRDVNQRRLAAGAHNMPAPLGGAVGRPRQDTARRS